MTDNIYDLIPDGKPRPRDIDTMSAGRELDALVAIKVMGRSVVWPKSQTGAPVFADAIVEPQYVPRYSTDIAAAWEVVDAVGKFRGGPNNLYKPVVRVEWYEHDGIATVVIGRCKGLEDIVGGAEVWGKGLETVALAICRAALKAVGGGI